MQTFQRNDESHWLLDKSRDWIEMCVAVRSFVVIVSLAMRMNQANHESNIPMALVTIHHSLPSPLLSNHGNTTKAKT